MRKRSASPKRRSLEPVVISSLPGNLTPDDPLVIVNPEQNEWSRSWSSSTPTTVNMNSSYEDTYYYPASPLMQRETKHLDSERLYERDKVLFENLPDTGYYSDHTGKDDYSETTQDNVHGHAIIPRGTRRLRNPSPYQNNRSRTTIWDQTQELYDAPLDGRPKMERFGVSSFEMRHPSPFRPRSPYQEDDDTTAYEPSDEEYHEGNPRPSPLRSSPRQCYLNHSYSASHHEFDHLGEYNEDPPLMTVRPSWTEECFHDQGVFVVPQRRSKSRSRSPHRPSLNRSRSWNKSPQQPYNQSYYQRQHSFEGAGYCSSLQPFTQNTIEK